MTTSRPSPAKRPDRSGSLHQLRTSGRWRATGYIYPPGAKPKRVIGTGATPQIASQNLQININNEQVAFGMLGRDALMLSAASKKRTLEDLLVEWLQDRKNDPNLRLNSYKGYEAKVRNYLIPHLGSTPLRFLDHEILQTFVWDTLPNVKDRHGNVRLGTTAHRGVHTVLQLALNYAYDRRYIDHNPIDAIRVPRKNTPTKEDMKVFRELAEWVPTQVINYLTNVERDVTSELRWRLAFFGLRQGEVLGLTDDCIRWYGSMPTHITVKQQLDRITASHGCGGYDSTTRSWACGKQADRCPKRIGESSLFIRNETKTESGDRELPLPPKLRNALKKHLEARDRFRERTEFVPLPGDKMDTLLFVKSNGHPIRPQDDRAEWARILNAANVTANSSIHLRVHDARHFAATIAVNEEIDAHKISMIFGWSPRHVQEMIRVYANPSSSLLEDGLNRMEDRQSDRGNFTAEEYETIRKLAEGGFDAELISADMEMTRRRAIPDAARSSPEKFKRALKNAQVNVRLIDVILLEFAAEETTPPKATPVDLTV